LFYRRPTNQEALDEVQKAIDSREFTLLNDKDEDKDQLKISEAKRQYRDQLWNALYNVRANWENLNVDNGDIDVYHYDEDNVLIWYTQWAIAKNNR
jgi:hypothetical protein